MITLDRWQDNIVDDALARVIMAEGMEMPPVRHGILSATGSGKTEIGMSIQKRRWKSRDKSVLPTFGWLAERTLLLEESRERINDFFGAEVAVSDIYRPPGSRKLAPGKINMLSPQTFVERGDGYPRGRRPIAYTFVAGMNELLPWDILIADEAHHGLADYYQSCIRAWPGPVIGLSGTWWSMSDFNGLGQDMAPGGICGPFDTLLQGPTPRQLIQPTPEIGVTEPRLSNLELFPINPRLLVDHNNLKTSQMQVDGYEGASVDAEVGRILVHSKAIVTEWERAGKIPCLAFCRTKAAAHKSADIFAEHGYVSAVVLAETPEADRREKLDLLNAGLIDWIASVDVFGEGINVPNVRCIAMLRPTSSEIRHRQFWGRGLRARPDGSPLIGLDFANNCGKNGSPLDGWEKMSLRARRTKKKPGVFPINCPNCKASVNWNQETCHGFMMDPETYVVSNCLEPLSWVCEDDNVILADDTKIHVPGHAVRHWCGNYDKRSKKVCSEAIENAINAYFLEQIDSDRKKREQERQEREAKRQEADRIAQERRDAHAIELAEQQTADAMDRFNTHGPEWRWEWERNGSSNLASLKLQDPDGNHFIAMAIRNHPYVIVLDPDFNTVKLTRPDGKGFADKGYQTDIMNECQIASKMVHQWKPELKAKALQNFNSIKAINVYI